MKIDEILTEDHNGFDFEDALNSHEDSLKRAGASEQKIKYIMAYIRRGFSEIKTSGDFQTWANAAQDEYDKKKQQQRDKSQDREIGKQREPGRHADGREKQRNQYTGPGKKRSRGGKIGKFPVPGEIKQGMDVAKKAGEYVNPFGD